MSAGDAAFGPQDALRLSIEDTGTLTARDLPMTLREGTRLLHAMVREGTLARMLPGVYSRMRRMSSMGREITASSHLDAIVGYARAHGRMGMPSASEAAKMLGLTLEPPEEVSYVWNGPSRLVHVRASKRGVARTAVRFEPMPDWAWDRIRDPNLPFLLALSHRPAALDARRLDAFVRRMGPNASGIAATPSGGMPHDLVLCLRRMRSACRRVLGEPGVDAEAVVRSIAGDLVPSKPFDQCRRASMRLVRALATRGVRAEMVQHCGMRLEMPDADPRWSKVARSSWTHWAVEIPRAGLHVDLTHGQFDPTFVGARIQPIAQARAQWRETH